jgi:hypothetical protein
MPTFGDDGLSGIYSWFGANYTNYIVLRGPFAEGSEGWLRTGATSSKIISLPCDELKNHDKIIIAGH